jgi:hypothetical protein
MFYEILFEEMILLLDKVPFAIRFFFMSPLVFATDSVLFSSDPFVVIWFLVVLEFL